MSCSNETYLKNVKDALQHAHKIASKEPDLKVELGILYSTLESQIRYIEMTLKELE